jgi:hypothetical protein
MTSGLSSATRSLHVLVSAASFLVVLGYAVTGLTLNHPTWISKAARTTVYRSALDPEWVNLAEPAGVARLEIVEELRSAHGVRGEVADFRVEDKQCRISFVAPGYSADAAIDRRTGAYELTVIRRGAGALLSDLHAGRGTGPSWSILIDLSAVLLGIGSLTGLALTFVQTRHRLATLVTLASGVAAVGLVYALWVP